MCDRAEFARMRDRIVAVEKSNIAQSEQIKTLFNSTARLASGLKWIGISAVALLSIVVIVSLLAVVYGALGPHGFNSVTHEARQFAPTNHQ